MDTVLAVTNPTGERVLETTSSETFDQIIRQHQKRVYRLLLYLVKDPDTADTLTQECFLRAYRSLSSFRGECRMDTWLCRIAVNLARDHGRNRRTSFWKKLIGLDGLEGDSVNLATPQPSAERVLLAREELSAVWDALETLSEQQRTVFLLRFAEEMSLQEIAETLGLKTGSVKAQLFRATGKIRETLKEKQ